MATGHIILLQAVIIIDLLKMAFSMCLKELDSKSKNFYLSLVLLDKVYI